MLPLDGTPLQFDHLGSFGKFLFQLIENGRLCVLRIVKVLKDARARNESSILLQREHLLQTPGDRRYVWNAVQQVGNGRGGKVLRLLYKAFDPAIQLRQGCQNLCKVHGLAFARMYTRHDPLNVWQSLGSLVKSFLKVWIGKEIIHRIMSSFQRLAFAERSNQPNLEEALAERRDASIEQLVQRTRIVALFVGEHVQMREGLRVQNKATVVF